MPWATSSTPTLPSSPPPISPTSSLPFHLDQTSAAHQPQPAAADFTPPDLPPHQIHHNKRKRKEPNEPTLKKQSHYQRLLNSNQHYPPNYPQKGKSFKTKNPSLTHLFNHHNLRLNFFYHFYV